MFKRMISPIPIPCAIPTLLMLMLVSNCVAQTKTENQVHSPATNTTPKNSATVSSQDNPPIVCAFFGRDNDLPMRANALVRGAFNKDGMPLNFRDEIDGETLDASDFVVIDSHGSKHTPIGATLRPATKTAKIEPYCSSANSEMMARTHQSKCKSLAICSRRKSALKHPLHLKQGILGVPRRRTSFHWVTGPRCSLHRYSRVSWRNSP